MYYGEEEEQRNREVVSTQLVYGTPARFEGWIGRFFFSLLSSAGLDRDPCCIFFYFLYMWFPVSGGIMTSGSCLCFLSLADFPHFDVELSYGSQGSRSYSGQ